MRRLFASLRPPADHTDRHLLDRFRLQRDEAAFAELVRRHGPLVWGVCRRTLSPADADDAFQATFLLLLRKPPAGEVLAPWLYRIAVLTARTARRAERRRQVRVRVGLPADEPAAPVRDDDLRDAVDAALMGLSARDRAAVVLCHLDGHTRAEAARLLGVPEGTLSARLSRALAKLRLSHGLGRDPAAALAVAGAVLVPTGLAAAAVRAGVLYLAGGAVPPAVATITRGVLTMGVLKSVTVAGLLLVAVAGAGVGVGLRAGPDDKPAAKPDPQAVAKAEAALQEAEVERRRVEVDAANKRAEAEARVIAARASLAAARDARANSMILTDSSGGFAGRYKLVEPAAGGELVYLATTESGLVKLLTRTRAAVPDQPLRVEVEPHQDDQVGPRLVWLSKQAGYTTVQYTGPAWANARAFAVGPLRVYKQPRYDEHTLAIGDFVRASQAATSGRPVEPRPDNPEVDMVSGPLDLTRWTK